MNEQLLRAFEDLGLAISNAKFDGAAEANAVKDKYNDMADKLRLQVPTKEEIIYAEKNAYLEAGHNAYFGNGFKAGVEFMINQKNN